MPALSAQHPQTREGLLDRAGGRLGRCGSLLQPELHLHARDHVSLMTTAGLGGSWTLLALAGARPLAAQLPRGDEAFRRGEYRAARAGYERELAADSLNVRALYRLAILDGWDGKLARSLARFAQLRRLEPKDEDIQVSQAQVLAWTGDTRASEALYDSVLAPSPPPAGAPGRPRAPVRGGGGPHPRRDSVGGG